MTNDLQDGIDAIMDIFSQYAVLDTVTWETSEYGETTGDDSSKEAIELVITDLIAEDFARMSAGYIPQSSKKAIIPREYTVHAGRYKEDGVAKQQFIHAPGDGSNTVPEGARRYEITMIEMVPSFGDSLHDNSENANKILTVAFLIEAGPVGKT